VGSIKHYILTATAEVDFQAAYQWSDSRWGEALTEQYFNDLHNGAQYIANNMASLTTKQHITGSTNLSAYPIREHYLVFLPVKKNFIIIIALLRQTQDIPTILESNHFIIRRELEEIRTSMTDGQFKSL